MLKKVLFFYWLGGSLEFVGKTYLLHESPRKNDFMLYFVLQCIVTNKVYIQKKHYFFYTYRYTYFKKILRNYLQLISGKPYALKNARTVWKQINQGFI